ncbi:OmpA family protein [Brachyspira pilosicoli]|uniref:OmpA family protein n=1 Tax=Brachyspira pilosicoli TaxID=52584 RepID=UPI0012F512C9|nr:OmpA family protein [Brachyspira pilosicoli]
MRIFILLFLLFFIGCQSAVIISKDSNEVNNKENITNEIITNNTNNVYYVQNTKRGKLLILKDPILFDSNSSVVNTNKYAETLDYLSLVLKSTNILNIYIEGHIDSSEVRYMNKNTVYNLSTTNNILYLYDRNNEVDLSYLRSLAVGDLLTDNDNKLKAIGLQNLIDYGTPEQNRRVEFVIIENSNDMYMYTNYIYNLY